MKKTTAKKIHNFEELDAAVEEYLKLQKQIKDLEYKADILKSRMKKFIGDREQIKTESHTVNYPFIESTRLDTTALRESMPIVYDSFVVANNYRRFTCE